MTTDVERVAAEQAKIVARSLQRIARLGGTEADFRREAAVILSDAALEAGLTLIPKDEYHVARGQVDSLYNRLVLEYKKPGILRASNTAGPNRTAIQQLKDYILDVAIRERREAHRLAGVATDGYYFIFVRRVGEGWSEDDPMPVNAASTELFLRLLFSLSVGAALIPENLVTDFGPNNWRAKTAVRAIYRAFVGSKSPLVEKLFDQWRQFFSEATDYRKWSERIESKAEFRKFISSLWTKEEVRHLDAAKVFFVLHTYYALLIKLVASLAAARFAGGSPKPLSALAAKDGLELKEALADVERGGLFREYGIRNFLEGDFFGWYLAAWNDDIEEALSSLIARLAEYDPGALELAPENARDLLKKLYHYLLPKQIRHDLGEYYTPDWLAERLIRQTLGEADLGDATKRVVDPACGSGTFLLILIKFIKDRASKRRQSPHRTLGLILRNIIGFDLNPLAVIAARTNYLIALGDLLKYAKEDIDIPVYQADSILAPSQGTDLFEGDVYPLKTTVGTFRVPSVFADRERMDALANALDEAVETGISEDAFLARVAKSGRLQPEAQDAVAPELRALYGQLRELHSHGINGVWARIIKNAFAPLFLEPCHFVVGNPPWVNWRNLPEQYRNGLIPLYEDVYGLFPHRGLTAMHGSANIDISSLMVYVAVDRYLRRGGRLGFVLTQSLFKTSGAGQGFRRFELPDKTPFGPLVVEDMVKLNPFEGAQNRTSVAVFAKGRAIRYPVSYQYWKKRSSGRGSGIAFDTPYGEVTSRKITFRQWQAEPVDSTDPTSAWITGRPGALRAIRKVLGGSPYTAHVGAYTGGANDLYWVERIGSRPGGLAIVANASGIQSALEEALIFPLLRGRDVERWRVAPSLEIICPQDPADPKHGIPEKRLEREFPKAHTYLKRFEHRLSKRAAYVKYLKKSGEPFYALYDIKKYTFAPWRVVWREQAAKLTAAVVGKAGGRIIVPDHKLMLVETASRSEAHYLCGLLNSAPATFAVWSYTVEVSTGTHVVKNLAIPKFSHKNPLHSEVVRLSERAHGAAARGDKGQVERIQEEVDAVSAKLWRLSDSELAELKRSLEEV